MKKTFPYDEVVQDFKLRLLEVDERFKCTGTNEDLVRAAEIKELFDLKLKELSKLANAYHNNNATYKAKAIWDTIN